MENKEHLLGLISTANNAVLSATSKAKSDPNAFSHHIAAFAATTIASLVADKLASGSWRTVTTRMGWNAQSAPNRIIRAALAGAAGAAASVVASMLVDKAFAVAAGKEAAKAAQKASENQA
jgi:hypothetical protein